jgi:hypothetical protein
MEHQASISPGLADWKMRLESDARNPVNLKNLQWELPEGITLDPVYDAGSLGSEHAYLRDFHEWWKGSQPHKKMMLKVSALPASNLSESEITDTEKLGFSAWVGEKMPTGHSLPLENPISLDPISESLIKGHWTDSFQNLRKGIVPEHLQISATAFHNAGANAAEDLAYCLSLAAHYRELLGAERFSAIADTILIHLSTGTPLFLEIARLRAMRLLWMNFTYRCGMEKLPGRIQAESSLLEWSKTDTDGNLLRHTASTMAAIMGGADSLLLHPHTLEASMATEAIRLSVNHGHLALEEARLSSVFDPGSGSYLIEILTHKLAQKAWELFCLWQEVSLEDKLQNGFFVKKAEAGAARIRKNYEEGRISLIGVNKHPSGLSRSCPAWPIQAAEGGEFPALSPFFLDA